MNTALAREIESIFQERPAPSRLKAAASLEVAARTLSAAATHEMTATTVVGVLGSDDQDAFRSQVSAIAEEYGLEARVRLQVGSYSVRFSRPPIDAIRY